MTAKGRFALARVLLGEGDRDGAKALVQAAYRSEDLSERTESDAREAFGDLLGRDDDQARMDKRIGARDLSAAMRAARRLGDDAVSIVKACSAVKGNDDKASDRLEQVSADARQDLGYVLCRAQWLKSKERIAEAARLILAAPKQTMALQDTDEWWRLRRSLARKLLDQGDFQNAYDVVRDAARPASDSYRSDSHFMPGWIALRYLGDAKTALAHFARVDEGCVNPISLARAGYWRGRAAEALGDKEAARANYEAAARYTTAYYGQLARARLGLDNIEIRMPPQGEQASGSANEIVRAAEMLYALGERETAVAFAADLAEDSTDVPTLSAVAEATGRNNDARAMLELGKTALATGTAGRRLRVSDHRHTAAQPDRSGHRPQHHLFGGPHRERIQSARSLERQRRRVDAGHAGGRSRHREKVRRRIRLGQDGVGPRLQHADGSGRDQRAAG